MSDVPFDRAVHELDGDRPKKACGQLCRFFAHLELLASGRPCPKLVPVTSDDPTADEPHPRECATCGHLDKRNGVLGNLTFRYAPSIISRCEADLFDISYPRFALQAASTSCGSVANLRRFEAFRRSLESAAWPLEPPAISHRENGKTYTYQVNVGRRPSEVIVDQDKCVGDSLVVASGELAARYDVLAVPWGKLYGLKNGLSGTPFVQHLKYQAGGLCAQASCYMANALIKDRRRKDGRFIAIHGIPEITATVCDDVSSHLRLRGLNWEQIVAYFKNIGATGWAQHAEPFDASVGSRQSEFAAILRAYLRSATPTIMAVNADLFHDPLGPLPAPSKKPQPHADHAVVVVGHAKQSHHDEVPDGFLINDPATLPFIERTAADLWKCAAEYWAYGTDLAGNDEVRTRGPLFVSVLPWHVCVPLESYFGNGKFRYMGLVAQSKYVRQLSRYGQSWRRGHEDGPPEDLPTGEFHLVEIPASPDSLTTPLLSSEQRQSLGRDWTRLRLNRLRGRWVWVQVLEDRASSRLSLWLWDAHSNPDLRVPTVVTPELLPRLERMLLGLLVFENNGWHRIHLRVRRCGSKAPKAKQVTVSNDKLPFSTPSRQSPAVSLITSYSADDIAASAKAWPADTPVEAYCFMQRDPLLNLLCGCDEADERSAVAKMAAAFDLVKRDRTIIQAAAASIRGRFPGRSIVALASFVPELSSPRGSNDAIRAVALLVELARAIAELQASVKPVIELVSGSVVLGVWQGSLIKVVDRNGASLSDEVENSPAYFALRTEREQAIRRLCLNLKKAIGKEMAHLDRSEGIRFAFELEPGPLYVLNDLNAIKLMQRQLEKHGLHELVGWNLDVAHWALAGIKLRDIDRDIFSRIVHAHISDHAFGHLGDLPVGRAGLGTCGTTRQNLAGFAPWLHLLRCCASRPPNTGLPFSGYVSVELEACTDPDLARSSVKRVRALLALTNRLRGKGCVLARFDQLRSCRWITSPCVAK